MPRYGFTFPSELNKLWRYNQAIMSDCLFKAAQQALLKFSQDPKYLNAMPGIISALHTWGRSLSLHPHIHTLVSHGGVNAEGEWVEPKKESLFPQKPLMMVFRGRFTALLKKAMQQEEWRLPPDLSEVQFNNMLNKLGRKDWVVHCCKRYDHAMGIAKYLSRYVKSGPIKKQQISQPNKNIVRFHYHSHQTKRNETLTLTTEIFVRRLIQHAPVKGKPTIRYCGVYNSAARKKLNMAREALGQVAVSARIVLQWQEYLSSKEHEVCCKECGLPVTRTIDILPFRQPL